MTCRVNIRNRIVAAIRIEIAALRQGQAVVKTNARHVDVYEATCGVVIETGCKVVQPYTGNKVVASVPERIERAYSVCVQRRVAGAPRVVSILRTFCSAFVVYLYHVAEYIFAEIILRSVYYHSARAFGVIHILHVFYVICKKRSVYTRHLFRQDSVSVTRHLSAVYVGVLCSRPVGVRVSLSVPRKNAVAVVKQIHVGKIRVGIFY